MPLLRRFLPFTRVTMLLWAWRNRASVLEWATFGLRAAQAAAAGKGMDDAKTEFRLRAHLAREPRTRAALVDVAVEDGVANTRWTRRVRPCARRAIACTTARRCR
jgi:hypothetical protein